MIIEIKYYDQFFSGAVGEYMGDSQWLKQGTNILDKPFSSPVERRVK